MEDDVITRLPVNEDFISYQDWLISYEKSHILKSMCKKGRDGVCDKDADDCCELCTYRHSLDLPTLPDMVFHKNKLILKHNNGAVLQFTPLDALRLIENGTTPIQVSCATQWQESRPAPLLEQKFKPFDWTFTSPYEGTLNEKFRVEETNNQLNKFKLMQREKILFYQDLTLFEDELHDHGVSMCTVKIRVMGSGFFILLRHFLRVDNVMFKMHDTRFHYEVDNSYIFKECTYRTATYAEIKNAPTAFYTVPNEIEGYLPIVTKKAYKLYFE